MIMKIRSLSPLSGSQAIQRTRKNGFFAVFPLLKLVASQVLIRSVAPSDQENLAKVAVPG